MRDSDAGIAQLVEHDLAKVGVASSSLVSRSSLQTWPRLVRGLVVCAAVRPTGGERRCDEAGRHVLAIHRQSDSAMIRGSGAGIAQLVEHDLAKVGVASSSLVSRSIFSRSLGSPGFCFLKQAAIIRSHFSKQWPGGRVVMQRPAKPRTPVRFRPWPPLHCGCTAAGKPALRGLFLAGVSARRQAPCRVRLPGTRRPRPSPASDDYHCQRRKRASPARSSP
jgi:hypothetical protein